VQAVVGVVCPYYSECRLVLERECRRIGLPFTVRNFMCHLELHPFTERFFVLLAESAD